MSSAVQTPSRPSTRIWPPATVRVSGLSTYVSPPLLCFGRATKLNNVFMKILRVVEIEKSDDVRRPYIKQLMIPKLKFPLPHRVQKVRSTFVAHRPATF